MHPGRIFNYISVVNRLPAGYPVRHHPVAGAFLVEDVQPRIFDCFEAMVTLVTLRNLLSRKWRTG
jgi:hypothetical protein